MCDYEPTYLAGDLGRKDDSIANLGNQCQKAVNGLFGVCARLLLQGYGLHEEEAGVVVGEVHVLLKMRHAPGRASESE